MQITDHNKITYEGPAKNFEPEHIRLQFFSNQSASFTDSYESAAGMTSL